MNSLFGVELPTAVTFIIAFVIVLALIGAAAWLVRRFGAARLAAGRGRQPRLAVIDAANIDGRRKLIIIRRDNVEHLLMIGGPTDVVVETNIMRASAAAQRDVAAPRPADTLPRAVPLPDATPWPAAEPAIPPRVDRPRPVAEESAATPAPAATPFAAPVLRAVGEPARAATSDPLVGLAAELSRAKPEAAPRPPEPPRIPLTAGQTNGDSPATSVTSIAAAPTIAAVAPPPAAPAPLSPDAHLAEMAQRLENALRRPLTPAASRADALGARPTGESKRMESKTVPFPEVKPQPTNGPSHASSGNGAPARSVYEDLEQEMASLLGRQSGKS